MSDSSEKETDKKGSASPPCYAVPTISEDLLRQECERMHSEAHICILECFEFGNEDYQNGVKAAVAEIFSRLTGKTLCVPVLEE